MAPGREADGVEVSVVLPAYNEADTIESTVATSLDALGAFLPAGCFEVIVAEDGCTDRTPEVASRLAADDPRVRHVHSDDRLGRGAALGRAFGVASGDTLVYFDTDLATDVRHLEELVESVRSGGYDVATGSRLIAGHEADRPPGRGIPSRVYNGLVRLLLRSRLRDHQCGFKAVSRSALDRLAGEVEDDHWFWDTELLVRAQRAGLDVREFPVDWEPKGDTTVDLVRDVIGMGGGIVRLFWQLSVGPRLNRRVSFAAGLAFVAAAVAVFLRYLDPAAVLSEISRADGRLVALATVVYLLSWPVRGLRYRDVLAELDHPTGVGFLTAAVFLSQTGNVVFPARAGDAIRAYVVKVRRGVPYPTGFASLAAERVFDLLTITALAGGVLVGYAATGRFGAVVAAVTAGSAAGDGGAARIAVAAAAAVGVAALAAVAAIVLSARTTGERDLIGRAIGRLSDDTYADRLAAVVGQFVGDVQRVAGTRSGIARIGAASLAVWTLDVLTAALVLAAFRPGLAAGTLVTVCLFAVSVGNLAKVLPLSPGGIGLYEAAFTLLVVGLTPVGPALAVGAALVDHQLKNLVTLAGGGGSMVGLSVSLRTAAREGREAERTDVGSPDSELDHEPDPEPEPEPEVAGDGD